MRVIRDSDDDLDDEDLEGENVAPEGKDASNNHTNIDISQMPHEPGTGSTDSLKRNIEAAHRAHFQSSSNPSLTSAPPHGEAPNSSSSEHRSKRRKTTADISPAASPRAGTQKNAAPKTYGRSKTIFSSPYLDQNRLGSTDRGVDAVTEQPWGLEGTLREDYAAHEAMAMFPEPSSTVPNTTLTQQRLLDEVMNPAFLGLGAEPEEIAPPYEPAKSSVPWSDFLHSPSEIADNQAHLEITVAHSSAHHGLQIPSELHTQPLGPSPPMIPTTQQLHSSNELGLSQRSRRIPLRNEILRNGVDPKDIMEAQPVQNQEEHSEAGQLTPSKAQNDTDQHPSKDERRSPCFDKVQNAPTFVSPTPKKKQKSSSVLNSEDDFAAIGIPKEQYKPRPSRSRSSRADLERPVDYSVIPEKAGKRGTRRSKTTAAASQAAEQSTPQKIQAIVDMGFTPGTTERVLKDNNGNVNTTVDWLITNGADELAPSMPSTAKRKAKKSSVDPDTTNQSIGTAGAKDDTQTPYKKGRRVPFGIIAEPEIGHDEFSSETIIAETTLTDRPPQVLEFKSPKVQVVIPPRSEETPNRSEGKEKQTKANISQKLDLIDAPSQKPKRRKTTLDQPEPVLEVHVATLPTSAKEKKRSRGRPRKDTVAPVSNDTIPEEDVEEAKNEVVQQEIQLNVTPSTGSPSTDTARQSKTTTPCTTETPVSTPPSKRTSAESSRTPEKVAKSSSGHSPLNKGKVPYRVGLSKRARIAPLLRVMKK